jgi:hypothetical protein
VKFERFKLQRIQPEQQFRRPLKTEAPLSSSGVDKEVLKARRPDDLPLLPQFSPRCVGAPSDPLGLLWSDVRRECSDSISQGRIISRRGERWFFAPACIGRRGARCEREQRDQSDRKAKSKAIGTGEGHVAHTLARSAGRQETQIILTADYAGETDFQNVLIQICVSHEIRGQYFGVLCCAADWKIAPICWW